MMEQQWPVALQVAFYVASGSLVLLAGVVISVALRIGKQFDRVLAAVERVEAELTPLARETRAVVNRLGDLSAGAQRAADAAGELWLPPVLLANRTARILRAGVASFLGALWNGRGTAPGNTVNTP